MRRLLLLLPLIIACHQDGRAPEARPDPGSPATVEVPARAEEGVMDFGPRAQGRWLPSDEYELILNKGGLLELRRSDKLLWSVGGLLGEPSFDASGRRFAFCRRTDAGTEISMLELLDDRWSTPRSLVSGRGDPDRPALSPDGKYLSYVSGVTGIASLWLLELMGGAGTQLTNVGIEQGLRGAAPQGFVPVPEREPASFEGDLLVWSARGVRYEFALKMEDQP